MPSTVSVPEMLPLQLAVALEGDDTLQVLDIRLPQAVAAGRIDLVPAHRFHNVLGSRILATYTLDGTGIDGRLPIVVVCGHGNASLDVAEHLNRLGYRAASLRGGMAAWMNLTRRRELDCPPSLDRFMQFDRVGKGALAYLLISGGEALIVDAPRNATSIVDAARRVNAAIVGVADTHMHADYVSGARALCSMLGVPYYLHPRDAMSPYDGARGVIDFHPIEDGDVIRVGRCAVTVRQTPGHTEGSVCFLVDEMAAITGDFLFVASVGRPDLGGRTREWTELLWRSLQAARRDWPPETMIYPAHYSSSLERDSRGVVTARLGDLAQRNEAFRAADLDTLRGLVSEGAGTFPERYRLIKLVNLGLKAIDEQAAAELEGGRSECALQRTA